MPIETDSDRATFTSPDEFGDMARYQVNAGEGKDIAGLFDDPSVEVVFGEAVSTDSRPTFLCAASTLPAGARGGQNDTLTIATVTYQVSDVRPDGKGMVQILLGAT